MSRPQLDWRLRHSLRLWRTALRSAAVIVGFIGTLMAFPQGSAGDTIFSNLGPSDTFTNNSIYVISGVHHASNFVDIDQAAKFTIPAISYQLTSTEVALKFDSGQNKGIDISVLPDSGGLPGLIALDAVHFSSVPTSPTLIAFTWPNPPLLTPGASYWISISCADTDQIDWLANNQSLVTPEAVNIRQTGWQVENSLISTMAFRVSGIPVPEPSTFILAAIAGGMLIAMRRRFAA